MRKTQDKPLDQFELDCLIVFLAEQATYGYLSEDLAGEKRLRGRIRRFVFAHPAVGAQEKRLFLSAQRKAIKVSL